ncbi:hypothetical protein [Flavobacterium sp.]|uniref:hypothetical protein n=1 Tax=Flavobacterium sp. TaxID=239 RepID=UPI0037533EE3
MDFYYHPILGLQITFGLILEEIDFDEKLKSVWKNAIELYKHPAVAFKKEITNAYLK